MMEFNVPEGTTPLDPNEIEGLIPTHISTRAELDRWEQENINEALTWAARQKPKEILNELFIKRLHKKCSVMYGSGRENFGSGTKTSGFPGT